MAFLSLSLLVELVQGKSKVACFRIVLCYVHIEILAVLVPVI